METKIIKKIRKIGNGLGVLLDSKQLYKVGLQLGDEVECKCSKNTIILVKKETK